MWAPHIRLHFIFVAITAVNVNNGQFETDVSYTRVFCTEMIQLYFPVNWCGECIINITLYLLRVFILNRRNKRHIRVLYDGFKLSIG